IAGDADDAVLLAKQIQRFDSFFGEADDSARREHQTLAYPHPPETTFARHASGGELIYRHENRTPDFILDVLRQAALAGGVLDQDHLADTDYPALAVTGGYLYRGIEMDDVPPGRRRQSMSSCSAYPARARRLLYPCR